MSAKPTSRDRQRQSLSSELSNRDETVEHSGAGDHFSQLTMQETADYVADLAAQLAQLAHSAGLTEAADDLVSAARKAAQINAS